MSRVGSASVLARVEGGDPDLRTRLLPVPDEIQCLSEIPLEKRWTRERLRRASRDAGRVDLDFRGSRQWRLIVELKINSKPRRHQLDVEEEFDLLDNSRSDGGE
jgi:hypothetical protein